MLRVVVCVSGGGTNLQAIIDGIAQGAVCQTEIVRVISNNPGAYALERAKQAGIEGVCVSPKDYENRSLFEAALLQCVKEAAPDLIVLAGFLVVLPAEMISRYRNRIINILIRASLFENMFFKQIPESDMVYTFFSKVLNSNVKFVSPLPYP